MEIKNPSPSRGKDFYGENREIRSDGAPLQDISLWK